MKSIICFLFTVVFLKSGFAQTGSDSGSTNRTIVAEKPPRPARPRVTVIRRVNDSPKKLIDTTAVKRKRKPAQKPTYYSVVKQNPYFNFSGKPIMQTASIREVNSKDGLFYLLLAIVLYFALVRVLFFRYLNNLYTLFFRPTLKQKQIREQLLQTPLPSLLLNILFVVSGGIYASFILRYYQFLPGIPMPLLMIYCTLALALIYFSKFLTLKFLGWIFNIEDSTDMYIFIVFMVNKLLGILLIPFIILMAFSKSSAMGILVTMSFILLVIAFAYRYIIAFAPIRKQINVSQFHFFLYICGFEIIPLLVLYKLLLSLFERSF